MRTLRQQPSRLKTCIVRFIQRTCFSVREVGPLFADPMLYEKFFRKTQSKTDFKKFRQFLMVKFQSNVNNTQNRMKSAEQIHGLSRQSYTYQVYHHQKKSQGLP